MKSLLMDISNGMGLAGRNLVDAAEAQDPELMEAVMVNVLSALPSYLAALRAEA
jgi:glyceraldehyde-3-phosphate dehydrogenase/erythrose-4-phosphate dehydrogenase